MKIGYLMQAGVPDVRQHPLSGPAVHVKHVFDELGKLGHQLCLLAFLDGRIWKSDDLEHFEPVIVHRLDEGLFRWFERGVRRTQFELKLPYAALFESFRFAQACCQELAGYDLFYERMGWVGYGGGLAARWLGIPLVLEVNGDHLSELEMQGMTPRGAQRWMSLWLMRQTANQAAFTVAAGEGLRRSHIERWGVNPKTITVIENGSDLVQQLDSSQLNSFRQSLDSTHIATIAYSGAFDPWQGVPVLLRAVHRVVASGIALRLLLLGSGPGIHEAEQLVEKLDLGKYVTFTGRLAFQEYITWLTLADIGVSPYCGRTEFIGLKLMDYKAAGLAIIASGENGQPKMIEHGRTGLIVPPCDEDALYQALVRLITDPELAKRMGRTSRLEAEHLHSWKNTAERLNELFSQLVSADNNRKIGLNERNALKLA